MIRAALQRVWLLANLLAPRPRWVRALERDYPPATLPAEALLVGPETTPRDINDAMLFGRPVHWVPEHNALRFDAPHPLPEGWERVGFTREAADEMGRWMRDTVQHLSIAPSWRPWLPPVAFGVPTVEPWPPEPPKPVLERRRLADDAVKGTPAVPAPPEDAVRPAFQPEPWQFGAWAESRALHDHIDTLIRNTIRGHEDATQAAMSRWVRP